MPGADRQHRERSDGGARQAAPGAGAPPEEKEAAAAGVGEAELPGGDGGGTGALREENARLRRELEEARRAGPPAQAPPRQRWRSALVALLVALGALLALAAVPTVFVKNQVLNTDRYVSTVAPLSKDPAIANVVATQLTNQVFDQLNVQQQLAQALPPAASVIAAPLANAAHSFVQQEATKVVVSDRFNQLWINMNRVLHKQLVSVLTGSGQTAVSANQNGQVTLDLHTAAQALQSQLVADGFTLASKIPTDKIGGTITLFQSTKLVRVQGITRNLQRLAILLPLLALVCWAAAIVVSRRRRRTVLEIGIAAAVVMALLAISLGVARTIIVNASAGHALTPEAASSLFDTVVRFLRDAIRLLFALAILTVFVAWLVGPSRPAVVVRHAVARAWRWCVRGVGSLRTPTALQPASRFVAANIGWLRAGVVGIACLWLVWWGSPGFGGVLVVLAVAALVLWGLEIVRRRAAPAPAGSAAAGRPG